VRLQSSEASCGPNGLANGCKALGVNVNEEEVVRWIDRVKKANPGVAGTTEEELLRAISEGAPKKLRLRARGLLLYSEVEAENALRGVVTSGKVAVLAVDCDAHWAVAVGVNGDRFLVVDGAEVELTLSYDWSQLRTRWEVAGNPPKYFGLVLSRG
jgi:hypothetical protein